MFAPPYTPPAALLSQLRGRGFAVLAPEDAAALCGTSLQALDALAASWDDLPPDTYLRDGGHYRRRRHACYVVDAGQVQAAPPRAHWQSVDYNALHGGMHRWFEPVDPCVAAAPGWNALLASLAGVCSRLRDGGPQGAVDRWYVEAHQFRIDTAGGIGRPTPEGAHRDGVDFVAVFLVARAGVTGGETRVFAAEGPDGQRFTLIRPWSLLLLDDARVIHESTPIQPEAGATSASGADAPGTAPHRDTLVLTFRSGGFQGDDATLPG
jgi:hypothetical protein